MADRDGVELNEAPEYLLKLLSRMESPTVEDVRRQLPERFRGLAEVAHARLQGTAVPGSAPAAPPATAATAAPVAPAAPAGPAAPAAPAGPTAPAEPARTPAMDLAPPRRRAAEASGPFMDPGTVVEATNADFAPDDNDRRNWTDAPGITVRHVRGTDGDGGVVRVSWKRPSWIPDGCPVVYRVASADREFFTSPEDGDHLTCLTEPRFEEPAPRDTGFRHYQVWANFGSDVEEIYGSQPRFVGEDICIFPVPGLQLVESQGVVEGRWRNVRGFDGIRIEAWPAADRQAKVTIPVDDGQHQFSRDFQIRGARMGFRISGEVHFRGTTRVDPRGVEVDLDISADLVKVELLDAVYDAGERDEIEFSWEAPPSGSVQVYFTPNAPDPDLGHDEIDASALGRELRDGSMRGNVLAADETTPGGTQITRRMVWPHEWDTVYVTPVCTVDERVFVGTPRILQRVQEIRDAVLVERVSSQLITFEWPAGATEVKVESMALGEQPGDLVNHGELDRAGYERDGGLRRRFDAGGERILLTPRAFNRGEEITAAPHELTYRGLEVYHWRIVDDPHGRGGLLRIWKRGGEDLNPPRFRLVRHHRRLPLSIADAATEGGGFFTVARVNASGGIDGDPGTVITPAQLPAGGEDAGGWLLPYEQIRQAQPPGQWYRLFIDPVDDGDETRPRRVVVDDMYPPPHLLPHMWERRPGA